MTRCLNCSVLDLPRYLGGELSAWYTFLSEVWMMASVALDTYAPALLRHSKHECPAFFWVEVSIGEDQQALVVAQLDVLFEVIKDLSCVELLYPCVRPGSCCHYTLSLKLL